MKLLRALDGWILGIERRVSELLLAAIIVLVFAAAFLRLIRHPLVWSMDLATLLFVWVCFIGADLAMEQNKHIGVDLLTNLMPPAARRALALLANALAAAFLALIAVFGTRLAVINVKDQFQGMELSHSWATMSAPVGCALMIRTLAKKSFGLLRARPAAKEAA
ncbi:MAG TPA: TRAP transporter small permease subunit [Spirochaetales bacterium]|nr:TRAP transporter small permease subunit [Spirochaetales bacterium]HRY54392.1 TRAP transporter small permease subunit [Spirochaetia bacterium]HRZ64464.1 TRAP transporter small permease subunit [Spirochaetia bacterium]